MTLLEELKDRADKLDAELLALSGRIKEVERESNELHTCINALDIAEMDEEDEEESDHYFLHPNEPKPAPIVNSDEGWELEPSPAELFEAEKSEAREQLEREDDASEFAEPMPDPEFVVLDEQTCEPVEEAPALNEQMQDEREQPYRIIADVDDKPLTIDLATFYEATECMEELKLRSTSKAELSVLHEGENGEQERVTLSSFAEVEPQPDGYAPVTNPEAHIQAVEAERYAQPTNPEADFWSRGLAPAEPEKKHRFSIFGHKRETEEVS
jgi:hypothetical protein